MIEEKVNIQFLIPELINQPYIKAQMYETKQDILYDKVIGIDLMKELCINILYSLYSVKLDNTKIPMNHRGIKVREIIQISEIQKGEKNIK